ncbi:hypothetical protein OIU77_013424 [Salix suchowensis]|uniref:Uncharacterized protein n=1 Tax=Salix suchowensis TaxID=1278906 RepID=A0ABQ8ZU01_9ROSI|nr:hypothetical protein OIU77_013424 [Salix suchowensis]
MSGVEPVPFRLGNAILMKTLVVNASQTEAMILAAKDESCFEFFNHEKALRIFAERVRHYQNLILLSIGMCLCSYKQKTNADSRRWSCCGIVS